MNIEEYILQHIDAEPPLLSKLQRQANLDLMNPRMNSGHLQGRLLKMIVEMIKPKLILELGTFAGYSALSMAEGLPDDGRIITIEIDDEKEDFIRRFIDMSTFADKITLHIGDACDFLRSYAGEPFDMVFIDADKRLYEDYYRLVWDKLSPGGFILADNTLWDGHVIDESYNRDSQTTGIRRFNDLVAADDAAEKVILPVRDGITLIRKKK
jgi:predicted O-methyltransferase YrrM